MNRGYIALITVLFLSGALLAVLTGASFTGFTARGIALDEELKRQSRELAYSCQEITLAKLLINRAYRPPAGGETVRLDKDQCQIIRVEENNQIWTIVTAGKINQVVTALEASASLDPPEITAVKEILLE